MKLLALALPLLLSAATAAPAPAPRPERVIDGTTVISARDPKIRISVPKSAHYLGAERWNLFDVADCEIHVFVEAGADKVVKRLYWIQFEGYLPHIDHAYGYSKDEPRRIQGLDFRIRPRFGPTDQPNKPGSDGEHVFGLVAKAGYTLPAHMMNVRLVHLLDESKRRELMVIYSEDLAPTGHTSDDLQRGQNTAPAWDAIKKALIERASARVRFEQ